MIIIQLRNIKSSRHCNNAQLFALEENRCPREKGIFHFFFEDSNKLHQNESRFKGRLSLHIEYGLNIFVCSVTCWD